MSKHTPWFRYGAALLAVAIMLGVRLLLDRYLGGAYPFSALYLALIFCAWYGGFGPTALATVVGLLATDYFLLEPRGSFAVGRPADLAGASIFLGVGLFLALVGERLHVLRRRAERSARETGEQRQFLEVTLASIGDGVITADAEGRVKFLNPVAEALTGWSRVEAAGRPLGEVLRIIDKQSRATLEDPAARVFSRGTPQGLASHTVLISRDGTERPIDDSAAPIPGKEGRAAGVVLVFRDVSERRRAEAARAHLAAIVESSEDAVFSKNLEGVVLSWNRGAERLYSYTSQEMVGQPILRIIPPELGNEFPVIMDRLKRGERIEIYETVRLRKDGQRVPVSVRISPVRSSDGEIIAASVIARDVTGRKQAEEAIEKLNQELRLRVNELETLFEGAPALVWIAQDPQCRRITGNRYANLLLGVTGGTNVSGSSLAADGLPFRMLRQGRPVPPEEMPLQQAVARREPVLNTELEVVLRGGRRVILNGNAAPFFSSTGEVQGAICVLLDVTALQEAQGALQSADRRKDEFLAMLAHELRNPLAPIRNAVQILRMLAPEEKDLSYPCQVIERQLRHLARLVDDLLEVSRITAGAIELRKERVDVAMVIARAVETARPLIDERRHELSVVVPRPPIEVEADPERLAQVLSNLLANAAKYTDEGGKISLSAELAGGAVHFRVKDNGMGIPAEMLSQVFDLFTQVDPGLARSRGGLGIGLTLVRRLVELHGGTVEALSEGPGKGSEFLVRLPVRGKVLDAEDPPQPREGQAPPLPARRVLVVEDNPDSAAMLLLLLKLRGHEAMSVAEGEQALDAARSFQPEVVLLDLGLPRMDGYEVARRLRADPRTRKVYIAALTGYGQEEDHRRTREAGFDRHLVKPVDPQEIEDLLAGVN